MARLQALVCQSIDIRLMPRGSPHSFICQAYPATARIQSCNSSGQQPPGLSRLLHCWHPVSGHRRTAGAAAYIDFATLHRLRESSFQTSTLPDLAHRHRPKPMIQRTMSAANPHVNPMPDRLQHIAPRQPHRLCKSVAQRQVAGDGR